jgi:hypothetical protein
MSSRIRLPRSLRLLSIAVSLVALGGLFQVQSSMAATSVDPGIYSGAPFVFKADRGIFSAVPKQQVDARIFSPISDLSDTHVQKHDEERLRLRHDL